MRKLDRLGWAAGVAFTAYGLRIGLRTSDSSALERLLPALPPGWAPAASPEVDALYSFVVGGAGSRPGLRRYHVVYSNSMPVVRTLELAEALRILELDLQVRVAQRAPGLVFVHAGVVGWRGRAIVVPGRSRSGKSSLVAALVRAGATYLSDEFAPVDARGRVHPYPVALGMRQPGSAAALRCPADALGPPGTEPLRPGLVVLTRYASGSSWRPRELTAGRAALEMLRHTVPARQRPAGALRSLSRAVRRARALRGPRGEADEVAPLILAAALSDEGIDAAARA